MSITIFYFRKQFSICNRQAMFDGILKLFKHESWRLAGKITGNESCKINRKSVSWFIPYLRVYHIGNYVIHHHVVQHGGSRSKNADLIFHFFFKEAEEVRYKRKPPVRRVVRVGRSLAGFRRRNPPPDASKWSPSSHHPTRGVFLYYFRLYASKRVGDGSNYRVAATIVCAVAISS